MAAQPGPEGEAAAQRRDEACYAHTMAVLRLLLDRAGEGVGGPGPFGHCAAFTLAFAAPIPTAPGLSLPPARIPAQP